MGNSVLFPSDENCGVHSAPVTITYKGFSFLLLDLSVISFKTRRTISHYVSFSPKNNHFWFGFVIFFYY